MVTYEFNSKLVVSGIKAENRAYQGTKQFWGSLFTFVDAKFKQFIKDFINTREQKHMVESE